MTIMFKGQLMHHVLQLSLELVFVYLALSILPPTSNAGLMRCVIQWDGTA